MFETIDPSAVDADRPVSDWIGKTSLANIGALAERGAGGGYVWTVQESGDNGQSQPSGVSTHPDYWYSIPFLVTAQPYQRQVRVTLLVTATAPGVRVRLWCEGAVDGVSLPVTGTNVTVTRTVTMPRTSTGADFRCAVLLQSVVGSSLDTGVLTEATPRYLSSDTNTAPADRMATHTLVELTATSAATSEARGWQGTKRYHTIRGADVSGDQWEVWPSPDPSLVASGVLTGINLEVFELGTLTLKSMQVAAVTGEVRGMPALADSDAGTPVRAEYLTRTAQALRGLLLTPQLAWVGGVGGVSRSTGYAVGTGTIPYRLWGAWVTRDISPVVLLRTAVRARTGCAGVVVSVMYASAVQPLLELDFDDGTDVVTVTAGTSIEGASNRDQPSDRGTMHWRHAPLTRDQSSAQDLGLHGAELTGYDNDTARLRWVSVPVRWPEGITPAVDDLVRLQVSIAADAPVYIAAVTVRELLEDRWIPQMSSPQIVPLREMVAPSWDAFVDRQSTAFGRLLRCVYSEWSESDPLSSADGNSGVGVLALRYRTSPDLPSGTVLQLTVDAESSSGAGSVTLAVDATTSAIAVTTRAVYTTTIAVASDTLYTVGVAIAAATAFGSLSVYLMRIEEV